MEIERERRRDEWRIRESVIKKRKESDQRFEILPAPMMSDGMA